MNRVFVFIFLLYSRMYALDVKNDVYMMISSPDAKYIIENKLWLYPEDYASFPKALDFILFKGGYTGKIVSSLHEAYLPHKDNNYGINLQLDGTKVSLEETAVRLGGYRYFLKKGENLSLNGQVVPIIPKASSVPQGPVNVIPAIGNEYWQKLISQLKNIERSFSFKKRSELMEYGKLKNYVDDSCKEQKYPFCEEAYHEIRKISEKFFYKGVLKVNGQPFYFSNSNKSKEYSLYLKTIANIIISDSKESSKMMIVPVLMDLYIQDEHSLVYRAFMKNLKEKGEEEAFSYILRKSSFHPSFKNLKEMYQVSKDVVRAELDMLCLSYTPQLKDKCISYMESVL